MFSGKRLFAHFVAIVIFLLSAFYIHNSVSTIYTQQDRENKIFSLLTQKEVNYVGLVPNRDTSNCIAYFETNFTRGNENDNKAIKAELISIITSKFLEIPFQLHIDSNSLFLKSSELEQMTATAFVAVGKKELKFLDISTNESEEKELNFNITVNNKTTSRQKPFPQSIFLYGRTDESLVLKLDSKTQTEVLNGLKYLTGSSNENQIKAISYSKEEADKCLSHLEAQRVEATIDPKNVNFLSSKIAEILK